MKVINKKGGSDIDGRRLIKNSEVIKVGDVIVDEGVGVANVDATTELILGVATQLIDLNGTPLDAIHVSDLSTGAWTSSTRSFTAGADNQTVDKVKVVYDLLQSGVEIKATIDEDPDGDIVVGNWISILTSDSSLLDASTASTTAQQFRIVRVDGEDLGTREVVVEVFPTFRQA
jgi:hypothetical protein